MILDQFSGSVFIDNKPLPEYRIVKSSTQGENIVTCWIASEAGKTFKIRVEVPEPQYPGIKAFVSVDGIECPPWVVLPPWTGTVEFDCVSEGAMSKTLMFKNIAFTDDDSALNNDTSNIGRIVMRLKRGTFRKVRKVRRVMKVRKAKLARPTKRNKRNGHTRHAHQDKVHERSKKGRRHQVGFGKEVPDQEEQTVYTHVWDNRPATVFIFNYTSLDNLQAMDIVPRTPNPPIVAVDGPREDQSIDMRIRELELELQGLRAQQVTSSSRDQKPLAPVKVKLEIDLTKD